MIKAIIFDMDGTLYDTETVYRRAWIKAGVPEELYLKLIGRSQVNIEEILAENGYDPKEIYALKNEYTEEELSKGIPLKAGTLTALKWCREHQFMTAIATSSAKQVAERYLKDTHMEDLFDQVISGNQLEHGKPAPDIFLYAAGQLHVMPDECVVVEDSYNGVKAGKAAEMITVMVPDLIPADEEMKQTADVILKNLNELSDFIGTIEE